MAGTFHFVAMSVLAVVTALAVTRGFGRPTWRRLGAAATTVLAVSLAGLIFVHGCDAGTPLSQWALGVACAATAILFVRDAHARTGLAIGSVVVTLGLCWHYTTLVHSYGWIGNPTSMALDAPAQASWHTWATLLWAR